MSVKSIRSALVEAYLEVADWPTVFENNDQPVDTVQSSPDKSNVWAEFSFIPGVASVATLGQGGFDEMLGHVQIDLHYPIGIGSGRSLGDIDRLRAHFSAGQSFTYDGQSVKIKNCSQTKGHIEYDTYCVVVTIDWRARIHRPII